MLQARRRATNWETMALEGVGLGDRRSDLRPGALGRDCAGVAEELPEGSPAHTIGDQHSKSQRGERRASQHQRIHSILHIYSPFWAGILTNDDLDAPNGHPAEFSRCHS
jgi:hypothetical protein